ncbi:MAG: alpha/beta fold hydrolase [Cyanobacteria bacterium P01_H01_bin.121]
MIPTEFYTWRSYRCAYDYRTARHSDSATAQVADLAILLIHPIGVGLSRHFWTRFCVEWYIQGNRQTIYNPDLLGCGDSDKPRAAYNSEDWAAQLLHFLKTAVQRPVLVIVQGALFPVAICLQQLDPDQEFVKGMILAGPPGWSLIGQPAKPRRNKILWNTLFDNFIGLNFYRYARRAAFLRSFSERQLFANAQAVDGEWLQMLDHGAQDNDSRYAVFSFLAGFWRTDYRAAIAKITQPTLVLFGEQASGIDRVSRADDGKKRLDDYLNCLPNGTGQLIPGRNVLPYESTASFVQASTEWLQQQNFAG